MSLWRPIAGALAAILLSPAGSLAATPKPKHPPVPKEVPLSVSTGNPEPVPAVPSNFLGLSFEVAALPQLARYAHGGDLVAMLRQLGTGVVRFGGVTGDEDIGWADAPNGVPAWASGSLDEADLAGLGALADASGWRVLMTIGFGHYELHSAALEAAAIKAQLGESLEAIEIGNEPDAYGRHGLRAEPWADVQYEEQVSTTRSAISALAGPLPLAGPDSSGSGAYETWGLAEAIDQRPALLTGHHYPLGCNQHPQPSIVRLLSPLIRRREQTSLAHYLAIARESEIPFRLDETNSVSCGGTPGISDTFSSALWALGLLTRAMSMGVSGVNLQGNPNNCPGYTPLCALTPAAAAAGELHAQPVWYALLLAHELIGEHPLATLLDDPEHADVWASAFQAGDGARQFVVADDDLPGERHASIALHVGRGFHGASVLTLNAPFPEALSGVRMGGREVAPDGVWSAPARLPHLPNRNGVITVSLAPSSAALVTVAPLKVASAGAQNGEIRAPAH